VPARRRAVLLRNVAHSRRSPADEFAAVRGVRGFGAPRLNSRSSAHDVIADRIGLDAVELRRGICCGRVSRWQPAVVSDTADSGAARSSIGLAEYEKRRGQNAEFNERIHIAARRRLCDVLSWSRLHRWRRNASGVGSLGRGRPDGGVEVLTRRPTWGRGVHCAWPDSRSPARAGVRPGDRRPADTRACQQRPTVASRTTMVMPAHRAACDELLKQIGPKGHRAENVGDAIRRCTPPSGFAARGQAKYAKQMRLLDEAATL